MPDSSTEPNAYLLAPLHGQSPPYSPWLAGELSVEPVCETYRSNGAAIELLTWGEVGKPGLLLMHGMGAHAGWWRFIAPALARDHRVAAISWAGMGGSAWREAYSLAGFAQDIMAALEAAGCLDGPALPILIGHSFGGLPLLQAASAHPDRIGGGIMIDSFIPRAPRPSTWAGGRDAMPVYPTIEAALARYRFAPVQSAEHLDIVDFIARGSLRQVEGGWTWRFDPNLWAKLDRAGADLLLDRVEVPMAILYGERSSLVTAEMVEEMRARFACCPVAVAIPDAAHHVMVDQPIALIAALRVASAALWAVRGAAR
jgi:pimeloyl-ACP methyl ester carboxylesterase